MLFRSHLRKTILQGKQNGMQCVVGGDFNLEQYRGWGGDRFEEVLSEMDLSVCNNLLSTPLEARWTFRSVCGVKRVLDYCIASVGMIVNTSQPIDVLVAVGSIWLLRRCSISACVMRSRKCSAKKMRIISACLIIFIFILIGCYVGPWQWPMRGLRIGEALKPVPPSAMYLYGGEEDIVDDLFRLPTDLEDR